MQKHLIERVFREGTVDTRKYRYRLRERDNAREQWAEIVRLPLEELGTTCALEPGEWEIVWDSRSTEEGTKK